MNVSIDDTSNIKSGLCPPIGRYVTSGCVTMRYYVKTVHRDNSGEGGDNVILNFLWCDGGGDDITFDVVVMMMIIKYVMEVMMVMMTAILNLLWWL